MPLHRGGTELSMKLSRVLFYFVCFTMLLTASASAYIDPSSMTYIIQIVAGVVIVIGTAAGVLINKAKRKLRKSSEKDDNVQLNENVDSSKFVD